MAANYLTRNLFLKGMSAIYLVAFLSLYLQIPGLYGPNGVLPAHAKLTPSGGSALDDFLTRPTLLWFRSFVGLNTQHAMELIALSGVLLALLGLLLEMFRTSLVYFLLLVFYGSLLQVGQVFLWFQWDTLLMEAGLLSALLAPSFPWQRRDQPWDSLGLWLVRWLLFRLMFASGVVKLTSHCPHWWALSALDIHFESQCLPTPLAWYVHQLPRWLLHLSVVATYVIEIITPVLFFMPNQRLRLIGFYSQLLLQICIILTGNYNFFNLLTIVLCFSLLDDDWLKGRQHGTAGGIVSSLLGYLTCGALLLSAVFLFELRLDSNGIASRITFSKEEFGQFVSSAVPLSIALAGGSFLLAAAEALTSALMDSSGVCRALDAIWRTVVAVLVSSVVFALTLVPHTLVDKPNGTDGAVKLLPQIVTESYSYIQEYHLFNSYGLFRQMTGTGGRPEVVLQGADTMNGPWKEIEFQYKPGDVSRAPSFVFPHQPRLDWQMWFAALSNYHGHPWLTSLAYRILTGQPEVLRLLDESRYPFKNKPPKYVRGIKYNYHFTTFNDKSSSTWWVREELNDYLPIFTADHKPLLDYLRKLKIIDNPEARIKENDSLVQLLKTLRSFLERWEPFTLIWSILLACLAVGLTRGQPWYQ